MQSNAVSPNPNSGLATGMADNSNVVNPQANSQPSAVQSLLASQNAPQAPVPQYQPPTPIQANTSKWSGLVQGALMGLAGGLKAGMQNVNTAGTRDFRPANGFAMGEQEEQNFRDQQDAKLQQENAQAKADAQTNFEDQLASQRASQEQILNRARTAEANLNAYKLAQEIDQAPKEAQDNYYKAQDAHAAILSKEGMAQQHAAFDSLADAMQWMNQTGHTVADTVFTHQRGPDGKDQVVAWQNPDQEVDAAQVNAALKPYGGDGIPNGATMRYGDFHSLLGQRMSKYADQLFQQKLQTQKDKAAMSRTQAEIVGENNRAGLGEGSGSALVDAIGQGKIAPERMAYLIARNPALLQTVTTKYPDFDSTKAASYVSTYKDFTSGKTSVALNAGATALKHLQELQQLNTDASHIPGTSAYVAYQNKADTVASELARFYGTDTVPGIAAIKKTLTSTLPGNRDAAITTQAKSLGDKLDSFKQTWRNAAPSAAYQAPLPGIDLKAKLARAALDPDYAKTLTIQKSNFGRTRISEDGGKTWQVVQQ